MMKWTLHNLMWIAIRCLITLGCLFTIKNVAHLQGYFIEYNVLVVVAMCTLVGIKLWFPSCQCKNNCKKE